MPLGSPALGTPLDVGDLVIRVQRDLRGATKDAFDILASSITLPAGTEFGDAFDRSDRVLNDNGWIPYGFPTVGSTVNDSGHYLSIVGGKAVQTTVGGASYAARTVRGMSEARIGFSFAAGTTDGALVGIIPSGRARTAGAIEIGLHSVHVGLNTLGDQTHLFDGSIYEADGVTPKAPIDVTAYSSALATDGTVYEYRIVQDADDPTSVTAYHPDGQTEVLSDPLIATDWGDTLMIEVIVTTPATDKIPSIEYAYWVGEDGAVADASAAVTYGVSQLAENALVGIDEETLLVRDISGLTLTLARGVFGTRIQEHAAGAVVEVEPSFFRAAVGDTIVEEIRSWPVEVYQVRTADLELGATYSTVDWDPAPVGFRHVLGASFLASGGDHYIDHQIEVTPNSTISSFPSGYAVRSLNGSTLGSLRLVYAADFDTDDLGFDSLLSEIGLAPSLYDAAIYGALWRLLAPREVAELDRTSQPQPRRPGDVPAGRIISMAATYKQLRDERIEEEITRLRNLYPPRF